MKKSEAKVSSSVKTTQQLHQERETIIQQASMRMQEESKQMMERYLEESKRRASLLQKEQDSREKEEARKAELMAVRMAEQEEKQRARSAELKRQNSLLKEDGAKKEIEAKKAREEAKNAEDRMKAELERQRERKKKDEEERIRYFKKTVKNVDLEFKIQETTLRCLINRINGYPFIRYLRVSDDEQGICALSFYRSINVLGQSNFLGKTKNGIAFSATPNIL